MTPNNTPLWHLYDAFMTPEKRTKMATIFDKIEVLLSEWMKSTRAPNTTQDVHWNAYY